MEQKLKKTMKFKIGGEIHMQMSFWSSPDRLFTSREDFLDPLCRPRGSPGASLGSLGCPPKRPKMGSKRRKAKSGIGFFVFWRPEDLPEPIWEPYSMFFYDFLRFYQAKLQYPPKQSILPA